MQTQAGGDWVERSGRRLAYIYATHGHGDHWFGTGELARRFPGVTIYATEGTIEVMRQQAGPSREKLFDRIFPGQIPETPVLAEPVPARGFRLEGNPGVAVETGPTAREFYDQMTGLYPGRLNPGVVWLGARGLLGG